jgi:hypothetical protein
MPLPAPYNRELDRLVQEGALRLKANVIFPDWLNSRMITLKVVTSVLPSNPEDLPAPVQAVLRQCANAEMLKWLLESADTVSSGEHPQQL